MEKEHMTFNGHPLFAYFENGKRVESVQTFIYGCKIGNHPSGIPITLVMEPWVEYVQTLITGETEDGTVVGYPIVPEKFRQPCSPPMTDKKLEELALEFMNGRFGQLSEIKSWRIDEVKI